MNTPQIHLHRYTPHHRTDVEVDRDRLPLLYSLFFHNNLYTNQSNGWSLSFFVIFLYIFLPFFVLILCFLQVFCFVLFCPFCCPLSFVSTLQILLRFIFLFSIIHSTRPAPTRTAAYCSRLPRHRSSFHFP